MFSKNGFFRFSLWLSVLGALVLAGCGGGSSSSSSNNNPDNTNNTSGDIVISEVSSCYYNDVNCWFEIYNPTTSTINLSSYSLRTLILNITNQTIVGGGIGTLNLSGSIPPKGYLVVSTNLYNTTQRGSQLVYIGSDSVVPNWDSDGAIEIVKNSKTVDFVSFGNATQIPLTSGFWSGAAVQALPSTATEYSKSIVRSYTTIETQNTHTAADWISVNFSTPGGQNDVPAGVVDSDHDGIPDSAKVSGGTFAGLDLYSMGARQGQKDLFIEVDRMTSTDPGIIPRSESLQKVVDTFAANGVSVHFDAGNLFSSSFSTAGFNLGQGASLLPYEKCIQLSSVVYSYQCTANTSRVTLQDWKSEFFDVRRTPIFHYLIFANSQKTNGTADSSGIAELPGNDFIVSMGGWGFTTTAGTPLNQLINMQASTIMHELGHNLNLHHGGDVDTNYKPNYWSIMNYTYQLNGLDANASAATAFLRWKKEVGNGSYNGSPITLCSLPNSPCGAPSQFVMDYSTGIGSDLNESALVESQNIGRGSVTGAYADWNEDGASTIGTVIEDLNGDSSYGKLEDYNDWLNIKLAFNRFYSVNAGVNQKRTVSIKNAPIIGNDDRQPVSEETAPSKAFFDDLKRSH